MNEDEGMKMDEGEGEERVKRTRTATERVDRLLMEVSQNGDGRSDQVL